MLETTYLTSAEKKRFIQEFTWAMIISAKGQEEAEIKKKLVKTAEMPADREREEALEKVRLIMRQFPSLANAESQQSAIETPKPAAGIPAAAGQFMTLDEKMDSLLNDRNVMAVECSDGIVRIDKGKGLEETGFRLDEQEIRGIIKKFSEKTKIPAEEGFFKASAENLKINAMISDSIGSRFLITKSPSL